MADETLQAKVETLMLNNEFLKVANRAYNDRFSLWRVSFVDTRYGAYFTGLSNAVLIGSRVECDDHIQRDCMKEAISAVLKALPWNMIRSSNVQSD